MAKHSFSPVLWFLLALVLRAEIEAAGQARNPSPSSRQATNETSNPNAPLRWKSSNQTVRRPTAPGPVVSPANDPTVDYEISGETYQEESDPQVTPTKKTQRRKTLNRNAIASRAFAEREYDDEQPVEFDEEQVGYEEEQMDETYGMEGGDPESDYMDAVNEGEYWGGEAGYEHGHHAPPSRFFNWLESFKAGHGYWFRTSNNSPPHIGIGQPLKGTSWLNRPNSIGFFAGVLNGDTLITNRVDQGSALFGGLRVGWDFDHYWGVEARGGWASPSMEFTDVPPDRTDGIFLCDASILYYPWGDAACRPYTLLGMGMAMFDFTDEYGFVHNEFLLGVPIGFGFKYMYHPNLAFRAEVLDNIAFGSSGLNTMNNLSFTLGMEFRFGGKPRSYYPWQPAKFIW